MKESGKKFKGIGPLNGSRNHLMVLFLVCAGYLFADDKESVSSVEILHGMCSPIVLSPESENAIISRRLFTELDYELAIFSSLSRSGDYLSGCVIRKQSDGYSCIVKRIKLSDLLADGEISLDLVSTAPVDIRSSRIEGDAVRVISGYLKKRLMGARYHGLEARDACRSLDGVAYDVYVKGDEAYDGYSACIVDPFRKSSYSCSVILYALVHLVVADEPQRDKPLGMLVDYLKSSSNGKSTAVDPFLEAPEPVPDVGPLPEE